MESLEDKVKNFLAIGDGFGSGFARGDASGDGYCDGRGDGRGYGDGFGFYSGFGFGDGFGSGDGSDVGDGDGLGDGFGVGVFNGSKVYLVDDILTIFTSIHRNVAKGFIVQSDLRLKPCFIVKENNKFAHGVTLRDAFNSLYEKLYDDSTEEERIEAFKKKFPEYDTPYENKDLFAYHYVLTGSCRMGRETFVAGKGLSLDGKTTVRQFVNLTQNAYGGDIIKKLPDAYGIKVG